MPAVVIRQRKAWRRRDGVFLYFEVRVTEVLFQDPTYFICIAGQRWRYRQRQG